MVVTRLGTRTGNWRLMCSVSGNASKSTTSDLLRARDVVTHKASHRYAMLFHNYFYNNIIHAVSRSAREPKCPSERWILLPTNRATTKGKGRGAHRPQTRIPAGGVYIRIKYLSKGRKVGQMCLLPKSRCVWRKVFPFEHFIKRKSEFFWKIENSDTTLPKPSRPRFARTAIQVRQHYHTNSENLSSQKSHKDNILFFSSASESLSDFVRSTEETTEVRDVIIHQLRERLSRGT